jgi:hypothetical protein
MPPGHEPGGPSLLLVWPLAWAEIPLFALTCVLFQRQEIRA